MESPQPHILIVEDEPGLAELLRYNLERSGYRVSSVGDGRAALAAVNAEPPDLMLLDLMLPILTGAEVAGRIRANPATTHVPIIMVTAKSDEVDELVGLTVGADDYITKPFSMQVLLARVQAVLRRGRAPQTPEPGNTKRAGPIELDTLAHRVRVDGDPIRLTLTEFRLLAALVESEGRVLSRPALMQRAMGSGVLVTRRTIDVHITALRRKLGEHGQLIQTVRGVGYRLSLDPDAIEPDID